MALSVSTDMHRCFLPANLLDYFDFEAINFEFNGSRYLKTMNFKCIGRLKCHILMHRLLFYFFSLGVITLGWEGMPVR